MVNTTGHPAVTSTNAHLYVKSKYCSIMTSRTENLRQISCKKIEKTEIISKNGLEDDCCDMGQNDTIGKIELNPSIVLSSDNTNCKNDIQLFHQLFDELSVYRDYH